MRLARRDRRRHRRTRGRVAAQPPPATRRRLDRPCSPTTSRPRSTSRAAAHAAPADPRGDVARDQRGRGASTARAPELPDRDHPRRRRRGRSRWARRSPPSPPSAGVRTRLVGGRSTTRPRRCSRPARPSGPARRSGRACCSTRRARKQRPTSPSSSRSWTVTSRPQPRAAHRGHRAGRVRGSRHRRGPGPGRGGRRRDRAPGLRRRRRRPGRHRPHHRPAAAARAGAAGRRCRAG